MKQCVIGIDVGTSGCKTIAVSAEGEILASATSEYPLYQPRAGWNEQDPADWWEGTRKSVESVMSGLDGWQVAGVSFSGQMHGMVALDKEDQVIRRAILWNDQRTGAQCDEITEAAGGLEGLLQYTNNMMLTGYTGGKVLWMKQNEPENYEKTTVILNPKDYIRFLMTGSKETEVSDASGTGLFHVRERTWSYDLIDKIGLRRDLFPKCVESTSQTGVVNAWASGLTGIPEGTPVFAGGGDAVISTTGLGLVKPGRAGVTLGTSGVVAVGLPGYADNPGGMLQLFCNNAPQRWMAFGCTLSAAGSYQWFRNALGRGEDYRALDDGAAEVPPGSDGLLFLPYLTGERCPVFDPNATGAFLGITSLMSKAHFSRAVMEGVCYSLKQVYDLIVEAAPGIDTSEIAVAGGGAKSPVWRQMLADVFGLPVKTVHGSAEGGAFGAALVAAAGAGLFPSLDDAMACAKPESETLPNPDHAAVYTAQYQKYVKMYEALKWSY